MGPNWQQWKPTLLERFFTSTRSCAIIHCSTESQVVLAAVIFHQSYSAAVKTQGCYLLPASYTFKELLTGFHQPLHIGRAFISGGPPDCKVNYPQPPSATCSYSKPEKLLSRKYQQINSLATDYLYLAPAVYQSMYTGGGLNL